MLINSTRKTLVYTYKGRFILKGHRSCLAFLRDLAHFNSPSSQLPIHENGDLQALSLFQIIKCITELKLASHHKL